MTLNFAGYNSLFRMFQMKKNVEMKWAIVYMGVKGHGVF